MIGHNILIQGGHVIDPANNIDQQMDLYLSAGKILALGQAPAGFQPNQVLDASGCIVCPGLIDLAANLREPGHEHKASIRSETVAAARGGITTLVCTPDTDPVIDTPAVWELIRRRAKMCATARVLAIGALTKGLQGSQLAEMGALKNAGIVAVSNASQPLADTLVARRSMEYAATFDLPVLIRAEDAALKGKGCAHEGPLSDRLGLPGIPVAAETVAVARDLALAGHTGARVHFHCLSSGAATDLLRDALGRKLAVSADVAIHQLFLLDTDVADYDAACHVSPPLRTQTDRNLLRRALADGTIQIICSDHQPHEADAKTVPFPETAPGISGLESLLPLALKLVDEQVISLTEAIRCLTQSPANLLGLPYGTLGAGADADICIFDPEAHWTFHSAQMASSGRNTPFDGWEFKGKVRHTIYEGRIVYSDQTL